MESTRTKKQTRVATRQYRANGSAMRITVTVRHDDNCNNGHNTFSIVADIERQAKGGRWIFDSDGCMHDEIAKRMPSFAHFIQWHLVSTDGPLHYVANSLYWAGKNPEWCKGGPNDPPNLDHFRSTSVWPNATAQTMAAPVFELTTMLLHRLASVQADFRHAVESLGFTY